VQKTERKDSPTERGELAAALINACEIFGTSVPLIIELSRTEIQFTGQEGRKRDKKNQKREKVYKKKGYVPQSDEEKANFFSFFFFCYRNAFPK
jgi:hypothetical protein